MSISRRNFLTAAASAFVLPATIGKFISPAAAESILAGDPIQSLITNVGTAIVTLLPLPASMALPKMNSLFRDNFDIPFISQRVMGLYWRQLDDVQKKDFIDVFARYVPRTIRDNLGIHVSEGSKFVVDKCDGSTINSHIQTAAGNNISVIWMLSEDSRKLVVDVKIGVIDLVVAGHDEMSSRLEASRGSIPDFINRLRKDIGMASIERPTQTVTSAARVLAQPIPA